MVSAQARVGDVRVEPGFRGRIQRTIARLEDETGEHRRDVVRPALHRAPAAGRWRGRRLGQGQALRAEADPRQPGVPGREPATTELLHAGRIVPVYPLTAGLTAPPPGGDPRGARQGRLRLPGVPAGVDPAEERLVPIARAIEEAHYPATFEGRDAALRRLAFDELLALQLGMVQRRRQRVRDAAPRSTVDDAGGRRAVATAIVDAIGGRWARRRADRRPGRGDGRHP